MLREEEGDFYAASEACYLEQGSDTFLLDSLGEAIYHACVDDSLAPICMQ